MLTTRRILRDRAARSLSAAFAAALVLSAPPAQSQSARYFARVGEVVGEADPEVRATARAMLEKEIAARPLFTADLGGVEPSASTLNARRLRGFDVSLRIEKLTKELKDPGPGRRLRQLAVGLRISVFGSDIGDGKMAFSGDGESMQMMEVDERRMDKETAGLVKDVLADAITQAVDQAVLKLSSQKNAGHAKAKNAKTEPPRKPKN